MKSNMSPKMANNQASSAIHSAYDNDFLGSLSWKEPGVIWYWVAVPDPLELDPEAAPGAAPAPPYDVCPDVDDGGDPPAYGTYGFEFYYWAACWAS